jgi:hypothetical protein
LEAYTAEGLAGAVAFVIHVGAMEWSSLVRAWVARTLALGVCAAALAAAGCHDSAAGGRNMDAAVEVKPDLSEKLPPPDVYCPADAAGGGSCPLNFCGTPKSVKALAAGETAELGADTICTPGYVCVPDVPTADGTALSLRCVSPNTPAVAEGMPCDKSAMRCKSDALCIESPDFKGMPFCSALCRADADCAKGSYCLEHPSANLPNGSYVALGYCTPKAMIKATACTHEADCPADQGCVSYGARTRLLACAKVGGTKSMGDACNAGADCRSGECFDREFHLPSAGSRAFCSGHCGKSSDCGADQRCTRVVLANNNTPADPFDDVVTGYCQSLFAPTASVACKQDTDCTGLGGTTCEKKYGLCYTAGTPSGAACTADANCELAAQCQKPGDGFPDGYCQTFGCAPGAAMTGVDSCPGADAVCAQRSTDDPLNACYEGCKESGDCSRFAKSYICKAPTSTPGAAASICLYDKGV